MSSFRFHTLIVIKRLLQKRHRLWKSFREKRKMSRRKFIWWITCDSEIAYMKRETNEMGATKKETNLSQKNRLKYWTECWTSEMFGIRNIFSWKISQRIWCEWCKTQKTERWNESGVRKLRRKVILLVELIEKCIKVIMNALSSSKIDGMSMNDDARHSNASPFLWLFLKEFITLEVGIGWSSLV